MPASKRALAISKEYIMTWEPIDFEGVVALDKTLVDKLNIHLQEEESRLGHQLLDIVHPLRDLPLPSQSGFGPIKLKEAIEQFIQKLPRLTSNLSQAENKKVVDKISRDVNQAFWEHISLIEGCVTELFQQLRVIDIESWSQNLLQIVDSLKTSFQHRIEELIALINKCNQSFMEHQPKAKGLASFLGFKKKTALDGEMLTSLKKTEEFLQINYDDFVKRYGEYTKLNLKVEQYLQKVRSFESLTGIDSDQKDQYIRVSRLIKFWELDRKHKKLSQYGFQRFFAYEFTIDKILALFKDYFISFKTMLFDTSRLLKTSLTLRFDVEGRKFQSENLRRYQAELHSLNYIVSTYRELLLRTDANPYIRSRLGFSEWVVAPEPAQTKQLLEIVYDIESLDALYTDLIKSIEGNVVDPDENPEQLKYEICRTIHQMEQPLSSHLRESMRAQNFVDLLEKFNELGSFSHDAITFVGDALSKAMRADWKYHVLNEMTQFHNLYSVHVSLSHISEERHHRNRLQRFKRLIQQTEGWIQRGIIYKHAHEIELDMQDIKGYLQDFYGYVQRLSTDQADLVSLTSTFIQIQEVEKQLLEYRYLFSNFFYHISQHKPEGIILRNRFLFVDQYFESIESKLHELRRDRRGIHG